ncbi:MAG: L17 family ribosomal protein [Thermoguttaceae bacterium]|nr:L17 family ribosomal protein [Thermoguttaceae bacterium]
MRHRMAGRKFGRNPKHQRALQRALACSLFLTERDTFNEPGDPKIAGRMITTIDKAKEVRPLVERCITMARRALPAMRAADALLPSADFGTPEYKAWRKSERGAEWCKAVAPVVAARRNVLQLLHNKEVVGIIFGKLAERFAERPGGYTRILRLATPRLGDGGTRAILEFVGKNDRVSTKSAKPAFEVEAPEATETAKMVSEEAIAEAATKENASE